MPLMLLLKRLLVPAVAALVAGCGGGLWIGVGDDDGIDDPPDVNLAASPDAARAGATVRLAAAASDDFGIRRVEFYRRNTANGAAVLLGSDDLTPYQWDAVQPSTGASTVRYFARAVDDRGQTTDSAEVEVAVLP